MFYHSSMLIRAEASRFNTTRMQMGLRTGLFGWMLFACVLFATPTAQGQSILDVLTGRNASTNLRNFDAPQFGYRYHSDSSRWVRATDLIGNAHFGVTQGDTLLLQITPMYVGPVATPNDLLMHMFVSDLGLNENNIEQIFRYSEGKVEGFAFRVTVQAEDSRACYDMRVLRHGNFAYLLALVNVGEDDLSDRVVRGAFRQFSFTQAKDQDWPSQLTETERKAQGSLINEFGIVRYQNGDVTHSIDCFKAASELDPDDAQIFVNYVDTLGEVGRATEGLAVADAHADQFAGETMVSIARAKLAIKADQIDRGLELYASAFAAGHDNSIDMYDFVDELGTQDRWDDALAALDNFEGDRKALTHTLWRAHVLSNLKRYDEAIGSLESLQAARPLNELIASGMVEIYLDSDQTDQAQRVCDQLIAEGFDNAETDVLVGRVAVARDEFGKARVAFESAKAKNPYHPSADSYLHDLSALVGRGDNRPVRDPIDPVTVPDELLASINANPGDPRTAGDQPIIYTRYIKGIAFTTEKRYTATIWQSFKVLNEAGVTAASTLEFTFDPLSERLFVNSLIVRDGQGAEIARGDLDDYYVIDSDPWEMATYDRTLYIPVPALRVGCTVELVLSRAQLSPPERFLFERQELAIRWPARHVALFVTGDVGSILARAPDGVEAFEGADVRYWIQRSPIIDRYEAWSPPRQTYVPAIALADVRDSWSDQVREHLAEMREVLSDRDTKIEKLSRQLTMDCGTTTSIVRTLARYVQNELTYKAIEFGRRGRVPHAAGRIVDLRYGDCKDHSLLLHKMLEAVGVESHMALIQSACWSEPDLPSMDQFDHVVVYVPGVGPSYFVDCTDKGTDVALGGPPHLAGARAYVIDGEKSRFIEVPPVEQHSGRIDVRREVTVDLQGNAAVDETVTLTGHCAGWMRSYMRDVDADGRRAMLNHLLAAGGRVRLASFELGGLLETSEPLTVHNRYTVRGAFVVENLRIVGRIPCPWVNYYLDTERSDTRQNPVAINAPFDIRVSATARAPSGFGVLAEGSGKSAKDMAFANWSCTRGTADSTVSIEFEASMKPGIHPAEQFDEFAEAFAEMLDAIDSPVTFTHLSARP